MPTDNGYSNQKKLGIAQFETVHNLGSNTYGKSVAVKSLYDKDLGLAVVSITEIIGANGQVKYWNIETTGHTAQVGDQIKFDAASTLPNFYFEVVEIPDGTNLQVLPIAEDLPIIGDQFDILGWVSQKLSSQGETSVAITTPPTQFNYDGSPQTVEQDTETPANNRGMPSTLFIYKDGVQVPITKDTGLPSNTVGVPVELVAASGTPINITAGDINVQLSDQGVNFDSLRVGDGGGNYAGITANDEIKSHDADVLAQLVALTAAVTPPAALVYQEILNLTTVAQTFVAPVGAKWAKVYAEDSNTASIRVKIGGVATISSGIQFQAGRSEDFAAVGDISVIAESGANMKINVIFGV